MLGVTVISPRGVEFSDCLKTDVIHATYYCPVVPKNSAGATSMANDMERYVRSLHYVERVSRHKKTAHMWPHVRRSVNQKTANTQEVHPNGNRQ